MGSRNAGSVAEPIGRLFQVGTIAGLSDSQLLGRFVAGRDEAAFAALVARHGPIVLSVCRQLVRDGHDAEDAFQAAFLVLARRAHSLRDPELLGHWLYRVARRSAQKANALRARRRERQSRMIALISASRDDSGSSSLERFEDFGALHREIDRLPERYRVPIVLCYLEGLSHAEVARRLSKQVGTVGVLLSRARRLLRERLERSGIAMPAAFLVAGWEAESPGAVPASLVAKACAATRCGAVRTTAVVIAEGVHRGMLAASLKGSGVIILVLAGIFGGTTLGPLEQGTTDDAIRSEAMPNPRGNAPAPASRPPENPDEATAVVVRGQVVDPSGKPVAGASVHFFDLRAYFTAGSREGPDGTSTRADGQFMLNAPHTAFERMDRKVGRCTARVVASAPGYGLAWADVPEEGNVTVRLIADDVPIEGRILDLEGRPVAGAGVKVDFIWAPRFGADLSSWISQVKAGKAYAAGEGMEPLPVNILRPGLGLDRTTGPDGRFWIEGIGAERVVTLLVSGAGIETSAVEVMTKNGPDLRATRDVNNPPRPILYRAARFTHASTRSRPIVGTIRDKDSDLPLVGAVVQGMVYEPRSALFAKGVEATTDAQGKYRLLGLPEAQEYSLLVTTPSGQAYPPATFRAAASSIGAEPLTKDMALKRGVLVRGRLIDKGIGRPVSGNVSVRLADDNPHLREFPGYDGSETFANVGKDGRFQIAALPGPSLLTAHSFRNRYKGWSGFDAIANPGRYGFPRQADGTLVLEGYHALAEINPEPGAVSLTRDLEVDPGRSASVAIVDDEGKPVDGALARGLEALDPATPQPLHASTIEVHALDPAKPRRLWVYHPERQIAGSIPLRGDEGRPLTLRMQAMGRIKGRLVDAGGRPIDDATLVKLQIYGPRFPSDRGIVPPIGQIVLGAGGRFRLEGFVAGVEYSMQALRSGMKATPVFQNLIIKRGETRNLGDIVLGQSQ